MNCKKPNVESSSLFADSLNNNNGIAVAAPAHKISKVDTGDTFPIAPIPFICLNKINAAAAGTINAVSTAKLMEDSTPDTFFIKPYRPKLKANTKDK